MILEGAGVETTADLPVDTVVGKMRFAGLAVMVDGSARLSGLALVGAGFTGLARVSTEGALWSEIEELLMWD